MLHLPGLLQILNVLQSILLHCTVHHLGESDNTCGSKAQENGLNNKTKA
jgi:hypothetical protein